LVNPGVFLQEIERCGLGPDRIGVDRNAGVIEDIDLANEQKLALGERLGSTGSGTGSAVSRRVLRLPDFRLAEDHPKLKRFLTSVHEELRHAVRKDQSIVVEGTQGFGLSLYHAEKWPYRTSRDTTAHSFLGEVGLGVRDHDVIMAIRTYPIRVAGESGPLPNEVTWEQVQQESEYPHPIAEFTTVTNHLRRVASFDWSVVDQAVVANSPTQIALHGADYLDYANYAATEWDRLTPSSREFVEGIEQRYDTQVTLIGTGMANEHIIDLRGAGNSWTTGTHEFVASDLVGSVSMKVD
jgi:adenylosuccinate synthase